MTKKRLYINFSSNQKFLYIWIDSTIEKESTIKDSMENTTTLSKRKANLFETDDGKKSSAK